MNKSVINKKIFKLSFLPILGLLVAFFLDVILGPSFNQGALYGHFIVSLMWSALALFLGVYMYSKCSSMNHIKFILGISSVSLGIAIPWMIGMS